MVQQAVSGAAAAVEARVAMLAVETQAVVARLAARLAGSGAGAQTAKAEGKAAPQEQAHLVETWAGTQEVPRVAAGAAATAAGVQAAAADVEEALEVASVKAHPVVVCRAVASVVRGQVATAVAGQPVTGCWAVAKTDERAEGRQAEVVVGGVAGRVSEGAVGTREVGTVAQARVVKPEGVTWEAVEMAVARWAERMAGGLGRASEGGVGVEGSAAVTMEVAVVAAATAASMASGMPAVVPAVAREAGTMAAEARAGVAAGVMVRVAGAALEGWVAAAAGKGRGHGKRWLAPRVRLRVCRCPSQSKSCHCGRGGWCLGSRAPRSALRPSAPLVCACRSVGFREAAG